MRIIIQAVRERADLVGELLEALPHSEVVWDSKKNAMNTFLKSLKVVGSGPALHLEDDIILTSDFGAKVSEALVRSRAEGAKRGIADPLVQFFSMRKADVEVGSRWDRSFMMKQCWYCPAGYADALRAFFPLWFPKHGSRINTGGQDALMAAYLKARKIPYWIHCPSLVDHRVGKSMIGPRSSKRQSKTFAP